MMYYQQQVRNDPNMYIRSSDTYGSNQSIFNQEQPQQQFVNNGVNNGFRNVQPKTRYERDQNKEQELNQRAQMIQRTQCIDQKIIQVTPDQNTMKTLLHSPDQNTTLFQPEHLRFQKDFAAEDKHIRENQRRIKDVNYEQRRIGGLERQGQIWQKEEDAYMRDENRRLHHAELYNAGKGNANGLAYNPLTLQYAPTEQGQLLRQKDDSSHVRAMVRAQNIDQRSNCGYNLFTGNNREGVETIVPSHLVGEFTEKVQKKDNFYNIKYYALQQQLLNKQNDSQFY